MVALIAVGVVLACGCGGRVAVGGKGEGVSGRSDAGATDEETRADATASGSGSERLDAAPVDVTGAASDVRDAGMARCLGPDVAPPEPVLGKCALGATLTEVSTLPHADRLLASGSLLFAGSKAGIVIYDVSAAKPAVVGQSDVAVGDAMLAMSERNLYVGTTIVDVTDPAAPVTASRMGDDFFGMWVTTVAAHGNCAYVVRAGDYTGGLWVFDVGDPYEPVELGSDDYVVYPGNNSAYRDGYVHAASAAAVAFDVRDPYRPSLVSDYAGPNAATLALYGSTAYLAEASSLSAWDIRDPNVPMFLGYAPLATGMSNAVFAGAYAYVGSGDGLHVFDITEPATLHDIAFYSTTLADAGDGSVTDVAMVGGDFVYAALYNQEIKVFRCEGR